MKGDENRHYAVTKSDKLSSLPVAESNLMEGADEKADQRKRGVLSGPRSQVCCQRKSPSRPRRISWHEEASQASSRLLHIRHILYTKPLTAALTALTPPLGPRVIVSGVCETRHIVQGTILLGVKYYG